MKKIYLILALLACTLSSHAVIYLTDSLDYNEENKVWITYSKSDGPYVIYAGGNQRLEWGQIYRTNAGIELNLSDNSSKATYTLGKKYAKLSFWMCTRDLSEKKYSLVTIYADGKRIYDEPYFGHDAPRWVVLDVTGVETLVFKMVDPQICVTFAKMQLWSEGETVVQHPFQSLPTGKKIKMVEEMYPYFMCGGTKAILQSIPVSDISTQQMTYQSGHAWWERVDSLSIGRHQYKSGLQMELYEGLIGITYRYCYFWLGKKYDKISFIVGPRDNRSSNASCWLVVKGDHGKILHESIVHQNDLPRQVVVDVSGQEIVNVGAELRDCDLLGGMTFGTVEMYAYPKEDLAEVPQEGEVNPNKEKIAKLPSPCPLMSSILPYSVRGKGDADAVRFNGESRYKTFSMGGEKFYEGFILTTGTTFLGDGIDSYISFDLAGEFDYVSFYAGMLSKQRVLDDDHLYVYADDSLVLDTVIHCTWPNVYLEVPVNKCRILKFAKPGHQQMKECYICCGDLVLYRGKPVAHDLFRHVKPECPEEADLIDLCERPYFHYVGRYLSSLTNFDFNDCFQNGETQRRFFQMKDGSKIYKGVMLEANMPLGIEDITISDAIMMCLVGAGSAISGSDFSAYTGVSAGGGLAGQMAILPLMKQGGGQASVVSFNPFGEYQTLTFTVANKSEYWDDVDMVKHLGERVDHRFTLDVIADQRIIKQIEVYNTMQPQTFTLPINGCRQLTFWLEAGDTRSGQFVLYDMRVSKKPCDTPVSDTYQGEPKIPEPKKSMLDQAGDMLNKALDKVNEAVENVNEILTPTDSIVTSPEGRPGEVVETGGALPPPVWTE